VSYDTKVVNVKIVPKFHRYTGCPSLSWTWALLQSLDVPANTGFVCDNAAEPRDKIIGTPTDVITLCTVNSFPVASRPKVLLNFAIHMLTCFLIRSKCCSLLFLSSVWKMWLLFQFLVWFDFRYVDLVSFAVCPELGVLQPMLHCRTVFSWRYELFLLWTLLPSEH
jgi:hypothetical protein